MKMAVSTNAETANNATHKIIMHKSEETLASIMSKFKLSKSKLP
jgi:hypothetical protein